MNRDDELLILDGRQVRTLLEGQERAVVELVREAYVTHARGDSSLPHSTFLNFPGMTRERIIALPAFLGGTFDVAGLKWIASFPENTSRGMERASAVILLNSLETGRPQAMMEGAAISAWRTAASAALAAHTLTRDAAVTEASLVGCGLINLEIAGFLAEMEPQLGRLILYDIHPENARRQQERLRSRFPELETVVVGSLEEALAGAGVVSFATTAVEPYVADLGMCRPGATILHVSLRDLTAECIAGCDNVVDDVDHVCRARTSLHLAEQARGSRDFIRCTLADVLRGDAPPRASADGITVFSPFGLGVLDLAVAQWTTRRAAELRVGTRLELFPPAAAEQMEVAV